MRLTPSLPSRPGVRAWSPVNPLWTSHQLSPVPGVSVWVPALGQFCNHPPRSPALPQRRLPLALARLLLPPSAPHRFFHTASN